MSENSQLKVISASRRVDMIASYPQQLVEILTDKCPPERVHTLVLWTKNATNLLRLNYLKEKILQYDQIYLHYSITGMGGSVLEPKVPYDETKLSHLSELVEMVGSPLRIRIRYDPIVHLKMPDGKSFCNLSGFHKIASRIAAIGIRDVSTSWMQRYKKVDDRLRRHGIEPLEITADQWQQEAEEMQRIARENGLVLHGCCVPGWPRSRCIDGDLFNQLHPKGYLCSTKRAKGQRKLCGCTESWDIGWYHKCVSGCVYCYGNPMEYPA